MQAYSEARAKMVSFKVKGVSKAATAFFTSLTLRLEPVVDWEQKTAATDGKVVMFNPQWFLGLPEPQRFAIIAHEGYHPAMNHHSRQGDRELARWNVACDLAINPPIVESGFDLPPNAYYPGRGPHKDLPIGLSAEGYYELLKKGEEDEDDQGDSGGAGAPGAASQDGEEQDGRGDRNGEGGEGEGDGPAKDDPESGLGASPDCDPGGCGGVVPKAIPDAAETKRDEDGWRVAVSQAAHAARQMGDLPGCIERLVDDTLKPKKDVWQALRNFVSQFAKVDLSYARPNRRYLQQGIIMPSLSGEKLGELLVTIDTSGSITDEDLAIFASNLQLIAETYGCRLAIAYHDTKVQETQYWDPTDGPLKLTPKGGGGTSHVAVLEWMDQYLYESEHNPQCIVAFTDLYTAFPVDPPLVPILWAVYGAESKYCKRPKAPWGTTLLLEEGK